MNRYRIYTDGWQQDEFEAPTLAYALSVAGCPMCVRDAASFEAWLTTLGGFGAIEENGERIAEVKR